MRLEYSSKHRAFYDYQLTRIDETIRDYQYCHPRWPHEKNSVTERINMYRNQKPASLYDSWFFIECASFLGLFAVTLTRMLCIVMVNEHVDKAHYIVTVVSLMLLWLRLMKFFRPFMSLGKNILHITDIGVSVVFINDCKCYEPFINRFMG